MRLQPMVRRDGGVQELLSDGTHYFFRAATNQASITPHLAPAAIRD
jgi:hypothetical protein